MGSDTVNFSVKTEKETTLSITAPSEGETINSSSVTVDWTSSNFDSSTQEFVITLDGEIVKTQTTHGITLENVGDGDHSVEVYTRPQGST